jgi:hypothetical protein
MRMSIWKGLGYGAILAGFLLLFDTVTFLRHGWTPLAIPMYAKHEYLLGYLLLVVGSLFLFAPTLARLFGPEAEHKNLSIRERLDLMPDRAAVFGLPLLVAAMLIMLWKLPATPKGFYVWIGSANLTRALSHSVAPLRVRVEASSNDQSQTVFRVQGQVALRQQLRELLARELEQRSERVVFIDSAPELPYAEIVYVVEVATQLHARPVLEGQK